MNGHFYNLSYKIFLFCIISYSLYYNKIIILVTAILHYIIFIILYYIILYYILLTPLLKYPYPTHHG